jgi:uncharacterized cupin superfamily protein
MQPPMMALTLKPLRDCVYEHSYQKKAQLNFITCLASLFGLDQILVFPKTLVPGGQGKYIVCNQ